MLSKNQITAAITAKLVNSHTKFLKMQKRIQNAQDDGAGDEDLSTEDQDNFDSEVSQ